MLWLRRCRMHPFSLQLYSSYLSRPSYRHCHPTGCEAAPLPGTGWMWDRREWPRLGHLPDERSEELTWWRANTTISCSGRDLKNEQTKIIRTKKKNQRNCGASCSLYTSALGGSAGNDVWIAVKVSGDAPCVWTQTGDKHQASGWQSIFVYC